MNGTSPTGVFEPLEPDDPRTVGGYRLAARLGAGGMGRVYLSHTPGGRALAVKVIREEFGADPEFRRRFRREVQAAQRVQGLYTAPVLDSDTEGTRPWLATAYIPGPSLAEAVGRHGPLPVPTVLPLLAGIAEALQAIHDARLVHRDLKPSNVLLAADGPRVIDFGIAHAIDATSLTSSGLVVGTPSFMAPEQAAGGRTGPATDVFALGQLAAYALTGAPAFGEGTSHAVLYRIVHEHPDLSGLPEPLRNLIAHCLTKDPDARPTVSAVMAACRVAPHGAPPAPGQWLPARVAAELTAHATPPAPPTATRGTDGLGGRGGPRRGVLVAAAAAAGALLATGVTAAVLWDGGADGGDRTGDAGGEAPERSPDGGPAQPDGEPEPAEYTGIDLPGNHHLFFGDDPPAPSLSDADTAAEIDFRYFTNSDPAQLRTGQGNSLVLLGEDQEGSFATCAAETRFTRQIDAGTVASGTQVCVRTGAGHLALVTVTGRSAADEPSDYLTVDATVWRDALG
ncbi:serine/threonine-protein kinase [Streptomyces sp. MP131-18]|uniref:serine/threonine-protein kinase n=1 Tax=Streptomyces sp. MP131-18 TaxID=1857892 RepID=UPI00097C64C5|nr:serine/threonine-protein kinase [Streptomyces sp. MP131-18]ONK15196.1 Serine/threonine-protein kinase AfsK [Streptomyces sp. MP131-18]